jgi:hypothetical protein
MVDVAIAANFVRELTAEQFEEKHRTPRRRTPAGGGTVATGPATGAKVSRTQPAARRPGASASDATASGAGHHAQTASRRPQASASDATASGAGHHAQTASRRPQASASRGGRFAATRFGRALYRLAQVRG